MSEEREVYRENGGRAWADETSEYYLSTWGLHKLSYSGVQFWAETSEKQPLWRGSVHPTCSVSQQILPGAKRAANSSLWWLHIYEGEESDLPAAPLWTTDPCANKPTAYTCLFCKRLIAVDREIHLFFPLLLPVKLGLQSLLLGILCIPVFFLHTVCMQHPGRSEEGVRCPGTGVRTAVSCFVGAGTQIQVLCESRQYPYRQSLLSSPLARSVSPHL